MKRALSFALFVSVWSNSFSSSEANDEAVEKKTEFTFKVSEVGKDKTDLLRIFKGVQLYEAKKSYAEEEQFIITKHIEGEKYLAKNRSNLRTIILELTKNSPRRDQGAKLFCNSKRIGTYNYKTATGSIKKIDHFKENPQPPPLSKADFTKKLKAGETFYCELPDIRKCQGCKGLGIMRNRDENSRRIGNIVCPYCDGIKFLPGLVKVCWK